MMRRVTIAVFMAGFFVGCATTPIDPVFLHQEPAADAPAATFIGIDSPAKLFVRGHEKVFVCEVDEKDVQDAAFDRPVRVAPGEHLITICYREGLNTAGVQFETSIAADATYQIQLGEYSYTKVNIAVIETQSSTNLLKMTTVPKNAGATTIIY